MLNGAGYGMIWYGRTALPSNNAEPFYLFLGCKLIMYHFFISFFVTSFFFISIVINCLCFDGHVFSSYSQTFQFNYMVVLIQLKGHNDFRVPDRNGWRWIQTPWYTNTRAQKVNCHFNSIILVNANKIKKRTYFFLSKIQY